MDGIKVLVYFKEHSRVFSVRGDDDKSKMRQLTVDVKDAFCIEECLTISFKKYECDWDEYVDLDENSVLLDKDRVRATISSDARATSYSCADNDSQVLSDNDSNDDLICVSKRRRVQFEDDDCDDFGDTAVKKEETKMQQLPSVIKKEKATEIALSPLPINFRSDVDIGLKMGKMSREATKSFLSSVASAMFGYKKFPNSEEYTRVALQIITKYPFLKPPVGSPTASIRQSLINRFKEFRRIPKDSQQSNTKHQTASTQKSKMPGVDAIMKLPMIPPGEDQTSFERHNKRLLAEYKKTKPNRPVVYELMECSFAMRRKDILQKPYNITETFELYPFLQFSEYLYRDMERILNTDGIRTDSQESWRTWAAQITKQALIEKSKNKKLCWAFVAKEDCSREIKALVLLPYLLSDSRSTPDHEAVIFAIPDTCDLQEAVDAKNQPEPYITLVGTYTNPIQSFLIIDSSIVCEVDEGDIPFTLLSSFFVYNIHYPKGCYNMYTFLEYALFNLSHKKKPPSVDHFLAALISQQ